MNAPEFPSLWNLAANPIFRRHAVARLRPWRLAAWILVSQVIAGFAWIVSVLGYLHTQVHDHAAFSLWTPKFYHMLEKHGHHAFLLGWIVVLAIQALLVILKGTFSVATGVAREANEGMIEAEVLSPLPTGHKVLGQLLGLPLLETVVAALLLVWAVLSACLGGVSTIMMMKVYLILATSMLFHHAIGLVAGTIIQQKILAGTLSQVMIILLHLVLPFIGGFGIGLISHLGLENAILHEIVTAIPGSVSPAGFIPANIVPQPVEFFRWEVSVSGYDWVVTASALAALLTILFRRWNDRDSQLLGKVGATVFTAWILLLTCGEILPGFWSGEGVPEMIGSGNIDRAITSVYPLANILVWVVGFALLSGGMNLLLTGSLVPSVESRARCAHLSRTPWWSDGRNALPWVIAISLLTSAAWSWVVGVLLRDTPGLGGIALGNTDILRFTASILLPACACYSLVWWRGWKYALSAGFLVWIVPPMVAFVGLLLAASPDGWPIWLAGTSGLILPGYAAVGEFAGKIGETSRTVLHGSLALHALTTLWFLRGALRK